MAWQAMPKKKRNPFGLSDRLYKLARQGAREARVPLSTYVRRYNLDKLEAGIEARYQADAAKQSKPRPTARRDPKEISTPTGGQPGWRRKK